MLLLISIKSKVSNAEIDMNEIARPNDVFTRTLAKRGNLVEDFVRKSRLKTSLEGCIGCGCLSLDRCRLYNTDDKVAAQGSGAQLLDENVQSQFLVSHKK